ncbi:MAG: EAL domain-containing protein [Acidimicrobiia bacterium]
MQTDRAEPKAPWWCSLWMVVATLTVLAIANVALWTTSNAAAEDRSKSLTAKAVGTMKRQVSARLEDINRLNLRANDAITNSGAMGTPSVTDGTTDTTKTIADFILESNVFDEQTGVLAIISTRPNPEGGVEIVEGFAPRAVVPSLTNTTLSLGPVLDALTRSRDSQRPTISQLLSLDGTGLTEALGGRPRIFLLTTPVYKQGVLVRNVTSAVWGDLLVTAVLREAPEFTQVSLLVSGEGLKPREVGRTLSSTNDLLTDADTLKARFEVLGMRVDARFKTLYAVETSETKRLRLQLLTAGLVISALIAGLLFAARQSRIRAHRQVLAALAQVSESEARFRGAFEAAPIGMFLATANGVIAQVNSALAELAFASPSGLLGRPIGDLVLHQDREEFLEAFEHALSPHRPHVDPFVVHLASPSARRSTATVSLSAVNQPGGEDPLVIGQLVDITERELIRARLEHQSIHDPLTNLPNRLLFMDRLNQALHRARESDHSVAVIFLDIDRFKIINDSLGHRVGDAVVVATAERIAAALRPSDTVARFGGDEFVVLCDPVADEPTAMLFAERLANAVRRPLSVGPDEIFVTASLGVAIAGDDRHTAETLVRDADSAMYRAKEDGRSRVRRSEPADHRFSVRSLQTGNDLHKAIDRDELRVHYQPLVELDTGKVAGFEALVRWQHPTRGLVPPADFIPLAEESGLIVGIGRWVFAQACRDLRILAAEPGAPADLAMSINIAPGQLAEPSLLDDLTAAIEDSGVNPDSLWLELTESTLMRNVEASTRTLRRLRGIGVHIGVDDFGTGYSSLSYLRRFPVETLKIDKSFVDGLGVEPGDTAIVTAVISLAHALGLETVAEGVESATQLAELRTLGCQYAQGFLLGVPVPVDQAQSMLAEGPWIGLGRAPV